MYAQYKINIIYAGFLFRSVLSERWGRLVVMNELIIDIRPRKQKIWENALLDYRSIYNCPHFIGRFLTA